MDQEPKASPHYTESSTTETFKQNCVTWAKLISQELVFEPYYCGTSHPRVCSWSTALWSALGASTPCLTLGLLAPSPVLF